MSKIISLTTENVQKISVVQITPEGNLVTIGGSNGQGKSSVLDSIEMALGGGDHISKKPVRRGHAKGRIVLDLGDIVVRRTMTADGGGSLVVTNADGVKLKSPQGLLDELTGRLSFDPLAFCSQKADKQAETLRDLMGLNFDEIDEQISTLFTQRTGVNREVGALKVRGQAMPEYPELEGQVEVSTADIVDKQAKASNQNQENQVARNLAIQIESSYEAGLKALNQTEQTIVELRKQLEAHEAKWAAHQKDAAALKARVDDAKAKAGALTDIPLESFTTEFKTTDERNRKIRCNTAREDLRKQYKAKAAEAEALTTKLEALEASKRLAIQNAKFPVPGLSLGDMGEVMFDGLPFEQANTAKQIEVSVAVGLAMNTKLKILLIRRGSDLDPNSLKLVADLAAKADAQVWLETSRTDVPISVIMEDGHVQGAQTEPAAEEEDLPSQVPQE